jgi:nitroreductase / dihydropteridine reductase
MHPVHSVPIVRLADLYNEPVSKIIGSFNYFASSYGLEPFKLATFKNSILMHRFRLQDAIKPAMKENYFLSVLLVNKSIDMEDVNGFLENQGLKKSLPDLNQDKLKNLLRAVHSDGSLTGKEWAFKQAGLGLRLLLSLAGEAGIEARTLAGYDPDVFNEVLGLDKTNWEIFSVLAIKPRILKTPAFLLGSSYGLN